ncbi:MAG TPA: ATP-dependent DNA ligase [Nevskiaceae bacterium]|nr:ATP-dependent DNA ligase [Nevskiaceae bacterium]
MKFKELTNYFAELEKTASRNKITEILAELFAKSEASEIDQICYLSLGRLAPLYEGVEFNLAEKMMIKALTRAYGQPEVEVKKKFKQLGDLGDVAAFFDKKEKAKPMSVSQAYEVLYNIAINSGEGSVERKISKMAKLLDDLDGQSAKYAVRIPLGRLRLGFSDLTILDALSWLIAGDKSKRKEIEAAYNVQTNIGLIAKIIKTKGISNLKKIGVSLDTPVLPALCQRLANAEEMIKKMGQVAVEPKYDGQRLQIHFGVKDKKPVRIFTRNLENVSQMFPDIAAALEKEVKAKRVILDGEAIGFDPKTGKFLPFQETIKRKRKYQIGEKAKEIPLKFFCFDILYKDGKNLIKLPFAQRRKILEKILSTANKTIVLSPQIVTDSPAKLREYHHEQIKKGLEGVVVKKWQAGYDSGRRGFTWVKFKQEKSKKGGGLVDTLDCVVLGFYRGRGRRAGFGIGMILVGVRKPHFAKASRGEGEFLTITKVGTGPSDDQWREIHRRCEKIKTGKQPKQYSVDKNLIPDVWCLPKLVVEIQADNITKSPIHTAKYALRFPRWLRFRDDKSAFQATTLKETEKLYKLQK